MKCPIYFLLELRFSAKERDDILVVEIDGELRKYLAIVEVNVIYLTGVLVKWTENELGDTSPQFCETTKILQQNLISMRGRST
jgi:hypothetical protein